MAKKRVFTISFLSVVGLILLLGAYWVFGALFSVDKTIPSEKLAKVEKEVAACERKLGDPRFVDRAPTAVVAEQRERLLEYQRQRDAHRASLAELEGR